MFPSPTHLAWDAGSRPDSRPHAHRDKPRVSRSSNFFLGNVDWQSSRQRGSESGHMTRNPLKSFLATSRSRGIRAEALTAYRKPPSPTDCRGMIEESLITKYNGYRCKGQRVGAHVYGCMCVGMLARLCGACRAMQNSLQVPRRPTGSSACPERRSRLKSFSPVEIASSFH